ncbi:Protein-methionine sulfoxide oxidase mical3a [Trichinella spiralis]|uniref:Protein-methionine sulfoxide oxidase mical3a n=1 Tax=Trichinella spiralis TaxID=6334 RepID=A0ABR3K7U4_TRISP
MVGEMYQKQIEKEKLKKKEEKKRQLMNQIRLQHSSLVNSERVSQPVVKNENSQEVAAYSPNTTSPANTPNTASPRSPIHQPQSSAHTITGLGQNEHSGNNETHPYHGTDKMIKAENKAENLICGINMPSVAHQAFQKTAAYNLNTTFSARPSNAIPRPPLPTIVILGQNGYNTNNYTHPYYGTYKMIKTENSAGNRNLGINMPSVAHQAFQKTAVYYVNTISAGRQNTAIPRPPVHTINEHSGNNETHPYHGTDKMIKAENKAENLICGINMPSVAHQAFQKTAAYNLNTTFSARPSNAIPRPPLPTIVGLGRKINMPSVAHQAFQKTAAYNLNTTFSARPSNAIPRPPLPTIVILGQNGYNTNTYTHPYYGTYKMIKTENSAGNRIWGKILFLILLLCKWNLIINMPSVAHQAFQETAAYNPNTTFAAKRNNAIPRPPVNTIVGLGRNNEGTSTNASLSLKQPIQDAAMMIGKPQDNQS